MSCVLPPVSGPYVIGVVGNSIAFGADVGRNESWPTRLATNLRRHQPNVLVRNGAVRASAADFAALCWSYIWSHADSPASSSSDIDLLVIDYSFTSSHRQHEALLRKARRHRIPSVALLYCAHTRWQRSLHALLGVRGAAPAADATKQIRAALSNRSNLSSNSSGGGDSRRGQVTAEWWHGRGGPAAAKARSASLRARLKQQAKQQKGEKLQRKHIENHARALLSVWRLQQRAVDSTGEYHAPPLPVHSAVGEEEREDISWRAATAVATMQVLSATHEGKHALAAQRLRIPPYGSANDTAVRMLRAAVDALAAALCLAQHNETITVLRSFNVQYTSNARQLIEWPAAEVLTKRGAYGAHPNHLGHDLMAGAAERLIMRWCERRGEEAAAEERRSAEAAEKSHGSASASRLPPPSRPLRSAAAGSFPEGDGQTCDVGEGLSAISRDCASFTLVRPGGGRTAGLVATSQGAHCQLSVSSSTLRAGFLSLAFERGWRNKGKVSINCVPPCSCKPLDSFSMGTPKRYTFTQRTNPVWVLLGPDGTCGVRVDVTELSAGRVMIQAATLAAPGPRNQSVDTSSFYSYHAASAIEHDPARALPRATCRGALTHLSHAVTLLLRCAQAAHPLCVCQM